MNTCGATLKWCHPLSRPEIYVEGLMDYQVALLNVMWECETPRELMNFRSSLTPAMQEEVDVLINLVHMEHIEPEIQSMTSFPMVERLLKKIKNERSS